MNTQDEGATVAEEAVTSAEATPASAPSKKKVAKKSNKPKAKPVLSDSEFLGEILTLLYALRSANEGKTWVDLRNKTKEGEALHKLLTKQPVYKWRVVGLSHYLEAHHTGDDKVVAMISPIDPKIEYSQALRDYEKALKEQTKKSKIQLVKPEKPSSMKRCYRWVISARRGDDTEGNVATFEAAVAEVNARKNLFIV